MKKFKGEAWAVLGICGKCECDDWCGWTFYYTREEARKHKTKEEKLIKIELKEIPQRKGE